jgi:hypothetical protein
MKTMKESLLSFYKSNTRFDRPHLAKQGSNWGNTTMDRPHIGKRGPNWGNTTMDRPHVGKQGPNFTPFSQ